MLSLSFGLVCFSNICTHLYTQVLQEHDDRCSLQMGWKWVCSVYQRVWESVGLCRSAPVEVTPLVWCPEREDYLKAALSMLFLRKKKNTPVSFHSANFCCYAIILFANAQKSKSDSTSRKQQAWRRLSFLFSCLLLVLFVSWHKSARDWLFE